MFRKHRETHKIQNSGWLRAAVLGANDGIVSTASLILGIAASNASHQSILLAGTAGLVAGAMSMATGEYVSVHSQADTEKAALAQEHEELKTDPASEHRELAAIYVTRGLDGTLAREVATQLMAHDALGAHARDELGINDIMSARPLQAALSSALSFAIGSAMPLLVAALAPGAHLIPFVFIASLLSLALLGGLSAHAGGASRVGGAARVTFWSVLAMVVTMGVGKLFGTFV
ncbi:Predicted Fe2+/Mn2+ transporter, VIT1/CCC1 family [Noviherbaspirillum humi]|uniref:Predicted Fe2+/Mn2+ transporter, VIT1/CCC1 family n=1 Tax=Noviherbaspirillum humi TaxID=1688639 RepID=A0A239F9I0_9BURK|nr:VIT family protein [Noviherbaspirillum humi]SNS53465.1 Predicted Fe2+/Mn2+ transporter, VIT1/CCC1 family [Noviherbaspirillum humi]